MPLKVIRRPDTGMLTIVGTIKLLDGSSLRVRQRAQSDRRKLADEEAALLEARLLREGWHGPKRGSRPFAAAVASYIAAAPRRPMQLKRIKRAMLALGDVLLSEIDQEALTGAGGAAERMFKRCEPAPQTVLRELITPVRAVMHYARRQPISSSPKGRMRSRSSSCRRRRCGWSTRRRRTCSRSWSSCSAPARGRRRRSSWRGRMSI